MWKKLRRIFRSSKKERFTCASDDLQELTDDAFHKFSFSLFLFFILVRSDCRSRTRYPPTMLSRSTTTERTRQGLQISKVDSFPIIKLSILEPCFDRNPKRRTLEAFANSAAEREFDRLRVHLASLRFTVSH